MVAAVIVHAGQQKRGNAREAEERDVVNRGPA
jgi:hypothetical protein